MITKPSHTARVRAGAGAYKGAGKGLKETSSTSHPSSLGWGTQAVCQGCKPPAAPFLCILSSKADASSHFLPRPEQCWHRFLSHAWWVGRNGESIYKSSFAFQSLINQRLRKAAGCHASQPCSWQICRVMSDLRENGKGETFPHMATLLERIMHQSGSQGFCTPSDFGHAEPHALGRKYYFTLKAPEKFNKVISRRSGIFSVTFGLPKLRLHPIIAHDLMCKWTWFGLT